jgi:SRSO17 transposase
VLSRLPRNAPVWLDRLSTWLEPFEVCFSHIAQRGAFRRYLLGLLSDSRRKSMSAMLERVTDPGTYQSFQHFITHARPDMLEAHRIRDTECDRFGSLLRGSLYETCASRAVVRNALER